MSSFDTSNSDDNPLHREYFVCGIYGTWCVCGFVSLHNNNIVRVMGKPTVYPTTCLSAWAKRGGVVVGINTAKKYSFPI